MVSGFHGSMVSWFQGFMVPGFLILDWGYLTAKGRVDGRLHDGR
jgi:hypothetical protein